MGLISPGGWLASLHVNGERHHQNVLRAQLAFRANRPGRKVQLRGARTLGDETPDAHLVSTQSIARRVLQLKYPLRGSGAIPLLAKWQTYLYQVTAMSGDSAILIGDFNGNIGLILWRIHHCGIRTALGCPGHANGFYRCRRGSGC